jgi:hypothetical protein
VTTETDGDEMVWKYLNRDGLWMHLELDNEGDVAFEVRMDGEEQITLYLDPKEAYLIGKKMMELGEAP